MTFLQHKLVHFWQVTAGHMHDQVMLKVVIDPIGCQQQPGQGSGIGGAYVFERIIRKLNRAMFGNIAHAQHKLVPGQQWQKPKA